MKGRFTLQIQGAGLMLPQIPIKKGLALISGNQERFLTPALPLKSHQAGLSSTSPSPGEFPVPAPPLGSLQDPGPLRDSPAQPQASL